MSSTEAKARVRRFGENELVIPAGPSPLRLFTGQFNTPQVAVLVIAAVISLTVWLVDCGKEELIDLAVILSIVPINTALGFYQEYKAERTLEALRDPAPPQATVIRDGKEVKIPSKRFVPGDLIVLTTGDRVSADARLVEAVNLEAVEATLTGESVLAAKDAGTVVQEDALVGDRTNMVHSGTVISRGRGRGVVVATGMTTERGKIAGLVATRKERTPLQRKLARLSEQLGLAFLGVTVVVLVIGLLRPVPLLDIIPTSVSLAVAVLAGVMAVACLLAFQLAVDLSGDLARARTAVCTLVLTQLFLALSFRSERASLWSTGLMGNPRLLQAFVLSIALQLAGVYLPFLNSTFRIVPLGTEWGFIVPLVLSGLAVNKGMKYIHNRMRGEEDSCEARTIED